MKDIRPKSLMVNNKNLFVSALYFAYTYYPWYLFSHFLKLSGIPSSNLPHLVSWLAGGSCPESLGDDIMLIFVVYKYLNFFISFPLCI